MKISGAKTIAEYKAMRKEHIEKFVDDNFIERTVEWQMYGENAIKLSDQSGDSIIIPFTDIP